MSKLDRIIINGLIKGYVEFDERLPTRFAKLGHVRLYRPAVGSCRWSILFGHNVEDHGLELGLFGHTAMMIASQHKQKKFDDHNSRA